MATLSVPMGYTTTSLEPKFKEDGVLWIKRKARIRNYSRDGILKQRLRYGNLLVRLSFDVIVSPISESDCRRASITTWQSQTESFRFQHCSYIQGMLLWSTGTDVEDWFFLPYYLNILSKKSPQRGSGMLAGTHTQLSTVSKPSMLRSQC